MTTHLLTSRLRLSRQVLFRLTCKNFSLWESYLREWFQPCMSPSPQTGGENINYNVCLTPKLHCILIVFCRPMTSNFASENAEWLATDCAAVLWCATQSLRERLCVESCSVSLILIVNITERQNETYLCRWQSSVGVYSIIDPVSAQMNGSLGLSAAARDLKPFQVSEGKTDHSLCHVGIPNPGQLLHWLKVARGTLRMFSAAGAKFKENRP